MSRTNFIPTYQLRFAARQPPLAGWRRVEPFMTTTSSTTDRQHEGAFIPRPTRILPGHTYLPQGNGYTYSLPERCGVNPWKDGHADEIRRLDYEPVGMVTRRRGARVYTTTSAPAPTTASQAWFVPHNPGRDPGAPGAKHTDYTAIESIRAAPPSPTGWKPLSARRVRSQLRENVVTIAWTVLVPKPADPTPRIRRLKDRGA